VRLAACCMLYSNIHVAFSSTPQKRQFITPARLPLLLRNECRNHVQKIAKEISTTCTSLTEQNTSVYVTVHYCAGTATGYAPGSRGIGARFYEAERGFSIFHRVQTDSGARPMGMAPSSGVKRLRREADHSPPPNDANNTWIYTSTPPYSPRRRA
jgi:hypothetical protein